MGLAAMLALLSPLANVADASRYNVRRHNGPTLYSHTRPYNLEIELEDPNGNRIDNLTESDFDVNGGDDNNIYRFRNSNNGSYEFALNGDEDDDTTYSIEISDVNFETKTVSVGPLDEDSIKTFIVVLEPDSSGNNDNNEDFNLRLNIEDEDGDEVDDLTSSDFEVSGGTINTIYAFDNLGNGTYDFELNGDSDDDTYYAITIDDYRYDEETIYVGSLTETSKKEYNVTLNSDSDDNSHPYNLEINIEDEDGDEVDDLTSSDFDISGGTDDTLYVFNNKGNGTYQFALNGDASDTTYEVVIDDSRYEEKTIITSSLNESSVKEYDIRLYFDDDHDSDDNDDDDVNLADDCDMPFTDLDSHWAYSEVAHLFCRGIVQGRSYYLYEPDLAISRAEFLKMAILNTDIDPDDYDDEKEYFDDVSSNDWFWIFVVAASELDLIDDNDEFRPNDPINRAEAVAMIVRLADVSTSSNSEPFTDVSSKDWFAKYVATAYNYDVVDGYGDYTFRPANQLTRAEAAVVVDNAFEAWYD